MQIPITDYALAGVSCAAVQSRYGWGPCEISKKREPQVWGPSRPTNPRCGWQGSASPGALLALGWSLV